MTELNTTREEREGFCSPKSMMPAARALALDCNALEDELQTKCVELLETQVTLVSVRSCLVKANANMEKTERELYLKLNAVEEERDKLREELESARRDLALLQNSWNAQQETIRFADRLLASLADLVDVDVLESWNKRNGIPEGWPQ